MADTQAYESRALAAYFREMTQQERLGRPMDQPTAALTTIEEHQGKRYVVLRNGARTLAIYRIRPHGMLRKLRRPPKALAQEEGASHGVE